MTVSAEHRSGRIHRDEWPKISGRRANGESLAAIGRDYGVTGSAISQILKKAASQDSDRAEPGPEIGPAPEIESPASVIESRAAAPGVQKAETEARERPHDAPPEAPKPALAERLTSAAHDCAALVTKAAPQPLDETAERTIKAAIHQVRLALAGIEIGLARRNLTAAADSVPQAPRERQEYRPRFADQPVVNQPVVAAPVASIAAPSASPISSSAAGTPVVEGKVKFFTRAKGFGFVVPDDGGAEIYVSIRALQKSGIQNLVAQQRVRVAVADSTRGPEADHIELIAA